MRFELSNNKIFKDVFDSVNRIIDEASLICDEDGIRLNGIDRSHVSFVELDLKRELFDEYICDVPEKINIDTLDLMRVLKRSKSNDVLKMENDVNNLMVTFDGDSRREFKIRLIDMDYESPTPPEIPSPVTVEIPCDVLSTALQDMELFGEKIKFIVDEDYIQFIGGDDNGDVETKYLHGGVVNESVSSTFTLNKLEDMMKSSKLSDYCVLSLGNDIPLKLKIPFDDDCYISYLLAPRLEEEVM